MKMANVSNLLIYIKIPHRIRWETQGKYNNEREESM